MLRAKVLEAELFTEREQLVLLAHYIASRLRRGTNPDIDATVELVCDFYFEKNDAADDDIQELKPGLQIFSQAVSTSP